ncbi:MAG: winged helix-turn-helix domain-containing protein [Myxococcota bacterium]
MRPLVDALRAREAATLSELRDEVCAALGLDADARAERIKWDGRLVLDHRLETAAETLDHAGLLARSGERWTLTETGRGELPPTLDRDALMIFPEFARYMEDFRARRGA